MYKIFLLFFILAINIFLTSSKPSPEEKKQKAKKIVEKANKQQKYIAKYNYKIAQLDDPKIILGANVKGTQPPPPFKGIKKPKKPKKNQFDYFDVRNAWPECKKVVGTIQDQSSCGGCWAVASASAMSDRYCINLIKNKKQQKGGLSKEKKGSPSAFFSATDILSCTPGMFGCNGGDPLEAWKYLQNTGVVSGTGYDTNSGCIPFPFEPNCTTLASTPACSSSCTTAWENDYNDDKRKSVSTGQLQNDVQAIQDEIRANGSVVAAFDVYDDFMYYSSGVYQQSDSSVFLGGHAVRLIGWGTDINPDGTTIDYWLGANQWNTDWGMNGYFKIARGVDECRIESMQISFGNF